MSWSLTMKNPWYIEIGHSIPAAGYSPALLNGPFTTNVGRVPCFLHIKDPIISFRYKYRCTYHTTAVSYTRHTKGTFRYVPILVAQEEIKNNPLKALKAHRTGGRGPDGRIWNHRRAGGHKKRIRIVDDVRNDLGEGQPRFERVIYVRYDPTRSADIAAVAGGNRKRFILASENMKAGDIIKTSNIIPEVTVKPKEGDSYPIGALELNTMVHNIEKFPGKGGQIAKAAGSYAELVKKIGGRCVVRMPSMREMSVSKNCMATVGRVSNIEHSSIPIGSAWRKRWLGIRPRSGLYKKKTGYHGRKIKPLKRRVVYDKPKTPQQEVFRFTV